MAFAAVNYVQARDKPETLRRERGFRPKGKGKGKGKGAGKGHTGFPVLRDQPQPACPVRPTPTAPSTLTTTPSSTTAAGFIATHSGDQDFTDFRYVASHLCLMVDNDSEAVNLDELEAALAGFDVEPGLGLADSG